MKPDLLFDITQEDLRFKDALKKALLEAPPESTETVLQHLQEESKQKQRDIFKKHNPPQL